MHLFVVRLPTWKVLEEVDAGERSSDAGCSATPGTAWLGSPSEISANRIVGSKPGAPRGLSAAWGGRTRSQGGPAPEESSRGGDGGVGDGGGGGAARSCARAADARASGRLEGRTEVGNICNQSKDKENY